MVRRALSTLIGLCWLLAWQTGGAGDYRLWLELPDFPAGQPAEAELGRPLTVQLWYRGPADLDGIITAPWQTDFAVDQGYASRQDDAQRLRLRLTPRRSGELNLPPLRLGGAQSPELPVVVHPALEAGEALQPHWTLSESAPWQRQELRAELWLDMATGDSRLTLGTFQPAGFSVQALPVTRTIQTDGRRRHHYGWLLRPQQAGELTLPAPVLSLVHDGVPRRRFHFPATTLTIKPLPSYVPPTVPVGRILETSPGAELFGHGIDPASLHAALRRAGLPASVAQRQDAARGTLSQARVDWTRAAASPAGVVFFDPDSGRLQTLHPQPPATTWQPAGWLLLFVLLLGLVWRRRALAGHLHHWRYRHGLRRRLQAALDANALAAALLAQPLPGMRVPPRTLSAWATDYARRYGLATPRARDLTTLLASLEQARFGNAGWSREGAAQLRALL